MDTHKHGHVRGRPQMFQPHKSPTVMRIRAFIGSFGSVVEIRILPLDIQLLFFHITGEIKASSTARQSVFSTLQLSVSRQARYEESNPCFCYRERLRCTCSGRNICLAAAVADDINTCICSIHTPVYGVLQGSPNDRALLSGALWQRKERGRLRVKKILSHSFPTSRPSTKRLSCFTEDHWEGDTKMVMRDTSANMVRIAVACLGLHDDFIYRRIYLNERTVFAILGAVQCSL